MTLNLFLLVLFIIGYTFLSLLTFATIITYVIYSCDQNGSTPPPPWRRYAYTLLVLLAGFAWPLTMPLILGFVVVVIVAVMRKS